MHEFVAVGSLHGVACMATKADLIKDLDYLSEKVGERTRTISLAIIAIWWAILIGKDAIKGLPASDMMGPACLAALSILSDFLQYAFAYLAYRGALYKVEKKKLEEFKFNLKSCRYRARQSLFYMKQIFMVAGLSWFIWKLAVLVLV